MELLKPSALLATLLLVGGCEFLREPTPLELTDEQVMVHSVLQAGSDTVSVLLTRVRPGSRSAARDVVPISGAEVRITGGGNTVRLAESPAGFAPCLLGRDPQTGRLQESRAGCYAAVLPGGVRAGGRYELLVLSGEGEIRGIATVPEAPGILAPENGARVPVKETGHDDPVAFGSLSIRWSTPEGASGADLNLRSGAVFRNGRQVANARCDLFSSTIGGPDSSPETSDSRTISFWVANCTVRPDSVEARLFLTAYDTVYSRYAGNLFEQTARRKNFAAGVTGALGVFAGAATAERRVTLVIVR
jgi:hypothetical protein